MQSYFPGLNHCQDISDESMGVGVGCGGGGGGGENDIGSNGLVCTTFLPLYTTFCGRMFDVGALSRALADLCEHARSTGFSGVSPLYTTYCNTA